MNWVHLVQKLHGIVGALSIAVVLHAAVLLRADRRPSSSTVLACRLAFGLLTAAVLLGWWSYLQYRLHVRGWMMEHHPDLHQVGFELKEALGWMAWTGTAAGWALIEWRQDDPLARRGARRLFWLAFAAGCFSAGVGLTSAAFRDLAVAGLP